MRAKRNEIATLAGGCFWCLEAVYELIEGDDYFVSVAAGVQEFTGQYTLDVTTFDDDIFWW